MPKDTMSPRDRWEAVLVRKSPDRIPMDYWATSEATEKLQKHLGMDSLDDVFERLHIDRPMGIGGRYIGPEAPAGEDIFGRRGTVVDYGTGTYNENVHHPLARFNSVDEIEAEYHWPEADWWDYSNIPGDIKGNEHRPISGGGSEPFLAYCSLRGMEQAFMDLVVNPEIAHYCLDKLFDLAYENTRRIFEAAPGKILMSYVAEDMGSQESLMFSPKQIHEFLIPRMKRIMDLVHDGGAHVFHHSDGAIRPIIGDMIDAGIDVLNPVQWRCTGMEREGLKRDFGDRLIFHGGVDNQETMVFGSPDDVREEVAENIRTLGAGGGHIIAPCHNIQAVSDPANVVALFDAGYELGWS